MEIFVNDKIPKACIGPAKKLFEETVILFRGWDKEKLGLYEALTGSKIETDVEKAVKNPKSNAIFVGLEVQRGKKEVVAVSHVRFRDKGIPKGWIYVQWIGALKLEKRYEHKDTRNQLVEVLSKPHLPKEKGWGDRLLEAILSNYKEKGCAGAYTTCPGKDSKTRSFFKNDHKFKETGVGGDGFIRLERRL